MESRSSQLKEWPATCLLPNEDRNIPLMQITGQMGKKQKQELEWTGQAFGTEEPEGVSIQWCLYKDEHELLPHRQHSSLYPRFRSNSN